MPTKLIKTGLIALTWIGAATLSISCSPNSNQSQASNTQVTETSNKQEKQTGDMMENGHESHDMSMDLGPADADYDLRFIDGMLMHHQGAVNMAEDALSKSQRPEIKKLAQDILTSQQGEIEQMNQWRKDWYNQ
jgi:uncharacterized protein (DUF305 family)